MKFIKKLNNLKNLSEMYVSSPVISYGSSETNENTNKLLSELISLLPLLHLNEQISLMSRLAAIIEKQTCNPQESPIKTKKIKKIPDAEYNKYLNSAESEKIRNASLSAIREMLKNDQW